MNGWRICAAALAGLMGVAVLDTSATASPITDLFVANVESNIAFLGQSSSIASDHSTSLGIRGYARGEGSEHVNVAQALEGARSRQVAIVDDVTMGRSVAIDEPNATQSPTGQAANGRAPMAKADLDELKAASGRAFDDLYWAKQLDALSQIEADYRAYIAQGDDPKLVALAQNELPKVVRRLALLSKI